MTQKVAIRRTISSWFHRWRENQTSKSSDCFLFCLYWWSFCAQRRWHFRVGPTVQPLNVIACVCEMRTAGGHRNLLW